MYTTPYTHGMLYFDGYSAITKWPQEGTGEKPHKQRPSLPKRGVSLSSRPILFSCDSVGRAVDAEEWLLQRSDTQQLPVHGAVMSHQLSLSHQQFHFTGQKGDSGWFIPNRLDAGNRQIRCWQVMNEDWLGIVVDESFSHRGFPKSGKQNTNLSVFPSLSLAPHSAILCAADHHGRGDHWPGPDPPGHRELLQAAHVHHHRRSGRGRLQSHGVPGRRRRRPQVPDGGACGSRHRAVCALKRVQQCMSFTP